MFTWFKKHIIFHILYIDALLGLTFLKRVGFYKARRSEKRGVLWLASYPVRIIKYVKQHKYI